VCTLLIYRRPLPGVSLAVAANRDELYSRPTGSFGRIHDDPLVLGGMDPEAGGTWLAVNAAGFVVAVTNARLGARRRPGERSRGLLALDLVGRSSFEESSEALFREDLHRYAPVNAVVASSGGMVVGSNVPEVRVEVVEEEAFGAGNAPAFAGDARVEALLELGRPPTGSMGLLELAAHLQAVLARHDEPAACHHLEHGGTVSSTVMLVAEPFEASLILHADGPPCRAAWRNIPINGASVA